MNFLHYRTILFLLVVVMLSSYLRAEDSKSIHVFRLIVVRGQNPIVGRFGKLIFPEVFKKLSMEVKLDVLPAKRASQEVSNGNYDGEAFRVKEYGTEHPRLIRVDVPVATAHFAAYTRKGSSIHLTDWNSLKDKSFKVDCTLGTVFCEKNVSKHIPPENFFMIQSPSIALDRLADERSDIFIGIAELVDNLLENSNLKDRIAFSSSLFKTDFYLYVHNKHKDLVPQIEKVLRDLQQNKDMGRYLNQALEESFKQSHK